VAEDSVLRLSVENDQNAADKRGFELVKEDIMDVVATNIDIQEIWADQRCHHQNHPSFYSF
jgi:hypothetical protein